jgi:Icc-related predicted phosphoesterase
VRYNGGMRIAFIGDVHGRALHAVAALALLQQRLDAPVDAAVQVGDFGYPDVSRADAPTQRYLAVDPSEGELERVMRADGALADALRALRARLGVPVRFLRGNHEDFDWLRTLAERHPAGSAPVDPFDLFHYVPDGRVLDLDGVRVGFLGGVEELPGDSGIDGSVYETMMALQPGAIDVLVTHEGPYGSSTGYTGDVHGARLITDLVATLQPAYHVFGHAHQPFGPARAGRTVQLGLDALVASRLWQPEARGLKAGCLALLDTARGELRAVRDDWLAAFPTPPFDFEAWAAAELR